MSLENEDKRARTRSKALRGECRPLSAGSGCESQVRKQQMSRCSGKQKLTVMTRLWDAPPLMLGPWGPWCVAPESVLWGPDKSAWGGGEEADGCTE